jgi:hypothetical protein
LGVKLQVPLLQVSFVQATPSLQSECWQHAWHPAEPQQRRPLGQPA